MSYNRNVIIIIPEALKQVGNTIAKALDPDSGGDKTFSRQYTDGVNTFYAVSIPCVDSFAQTVAAVISGALSLSVLVADAYASRFPGDTAPEEADCAYFLAAADIRIDAVFSEVLAEVGLTASPDDPVM